MPRGSRCARGRIVGYRYNGFLFPTDLMMARSVLSEDQRKRVVYVHAHLQRWTHYELLRIGRRAKDGAIRDAYRQRCLEWHPDTFPHGDRGPFASLIDAVFARVNEAHAVLADRTRRAEYDAACGILPPDDSDIEQMRAEQDRGTREQRRAMLEQERRRRRNPLRKQRDKARAYFEQAQAAQDAGQLVDAMRLAQLASSYDPKNDVYRRHAEQAIRDAGNERIGPHMRQGRALQDVMRYPQAIPYFEEAVRVAPENGEARWRLAYVMIKAGLDPNQARVHAQKALTLLGDQPESQLAMALCCDAAGMHKRAIAHCEKALAIREKYEEARRLLRKLKRGF